MNAANYIDDSQRRHTFAVLAYKESPYIEECIQSLKKQTVSSKIVLSTSTPSDYLNDLAEKYGLRLFCNSRRHSIASDWSFAYNSSATQYVTLAHQDDIYYPKYTEHCLLLAEKHPNSLIAFSGYDELRDGKLRSWTLNLAIKRIILRSLYVNASVLRHHFLKRALLAFGSPIPCPSVMFNKHSIGQFEFLDQFSVNMDWDAWMRLAEKGGAFLFVRERLMAHRIHRRSQTTIGLSDNLRQNEDRALFERVWPTPVAAVIARLYALSYKSNG